MLGSPFLALERGQVMYELPKQPSKSGFLFLNNQEYQSLDSTVWATMTAGPTLKKGPKKQSHASDNVIRANLTASIKPLVE